MTLIDFVWQHRSLEQASLADQVLAIAWFWHRHEPNRILRYNEMAQAFKDVGLDSTDLLETWQELSTSRPLKLIMVTSNNYKLSLPILRALDEKYAESPLLPAGRTQNRVGERNHALDMAMNKLKVLFLAANPTGTLALQLDEEIRQISAKIRAAEYRDALELVSLWAVQPDDLLQGLLEHKPHIVHFSGHGSSTAEIILKDRDGGPKPVTKTALISLFRTLKDNVRVLVLNACSTRPQAEALGEVIDCVVGMNKPIGDAAAIVFAASFYRAIGFGRSIQEAFELGKVALLLEGIPEDHTPELFVRKGIDAATLTLVVPPSKSSEDVVPRQRGGESPAEPLPTMDRLSFVRTLSGLTLADLELFVATIPKAASQISRQGTIPEKVAELIRWADSSAGPGIDAVHEAYQNFR